MATEGYQGSQQFPATTNHRVIRMNLDGESQGFSFVKQAQYQQQGVIAFEKHQAAKRSVKTFQQLLKIVEVFLIILLGLMLSLNKMSMSIIKRVCNNFH